MLLGNILSRKIQHFDGGQDFYFQQQENFGLMIEKQKSGEELRQQNAVVWFRWMK